jgi:hypothetical protein
MDGGSFTGYFEGKVIHYGVRLPEALRDIYLCRSGMDMPIEETRTEEFDEHSCWSA